MNINIFPHEFFEQEVCLSAWLFLQACVDKFKSSRHVRSCHSMSKMRINSVFLNEIWCRWWGHGQKEADQAAV